MDEPETPAADLLELVARAARSFDASIRDLPVSMPSPTRDIRAALAPYDFAAPRDPAGVLGAVASMLTRWNVQVTHPRYFGLFNPSVLPAAVAAEALAAVVNPQMAVWSHSP